MKLKFSKLDLVAILPELVAKCQGLRVGNIYNINNKTYLIKLTKSGNEEENEDLNKLVLLIENGCRIHLTEYDWPKESFPNSFSLKMRKHLKNKRIEKINQIGNDRIVDIQFGINGSSYHLIVELYDKGNLILTDYNYIILNVLRPKLVNTEKVFVNSQYILEKPNSQQNMKNKFTLEEIKSVLETAKPGNNLKKIFFSKLFILPPLLEHCFIENNIDPDYKIKPKNNNIDCEKILKSINLADELIDKIVKNPVGIIIQKVEEFTNFENNEQQKKELVTFLEFQPFFFNQYKNLSKKNNSYIQFESFNKAVDVYFSGYEMKKMDRKIYQKEKDALKKLDNVKKDHERRLKDLEEQQKADSRKGSLIEMNNDLVEKALFILRSALANQMTWSDIKYMLKEAQDKGDLVDKSIHSLQFNTNSFTMILKDPYDNQSETSTETNENKTLVKIDLDLSAYSNARKYYENRKFAKIKEDKTIEASSKALKNAKYKANQVLKEVQIKSFIIKSRKVLWFEKFFWFISSENYIVIGGRDAQQNEMIVKRYMKAGDLYVHADIHGASSVVIKNFDPSKKISSKTIEEAACMAVCYSSAWDSKVPCRAWWVNSDQVSKTAPSGEYLTVGSFMIRGKKNYLPLSQLVLGLSFYFRLSEESIPNHVNDRKVKIIESCTEEKTQNDEIKENESDQDEKEYPNTKIKVIQDENKNNEKDFIIESKKARCKIQKKNKYNKHNLKNDTEKEQLVSKNLNLNKNKKNKRKSKKNDGWSEDEVDKMDLKIFRKTKKSDRLMDLKDYIKTIEADTCEQNQNNDNSSNEKDDNLDSKEDDNNDKVGIEYSSFNLDDNKESDSDREEEKKTEKNLEENEINENIEENEDDNDYEDNDLSNEKKIEEHLKLVNSITGQPLKEDNLLYTIPVIAPYSVVVNNKFKVKVLPGYSKRGRCSRTALELFLKDKKITSREKELFKSIKNQDFARNLPNKIKIAAQNLQKIKLKN